MNLINAIFFDLDDTLFDATGLAELARKNAIEKMIEKGLCGITFEEGYAILKEIVSEYGSNFTKHFDMFLQRLDCYSTKLVSAAIIAYHEVKVDEIKLYPDVLGFLKKVTENFGCKLGIITDGLPIKQYEKILRLNLDEFIEDVYISDEIGIRKPNPKLFTTALERSGIEPGNSLYIGDHYHNDVLPAKKIGMQTCLIHRKGKHDIILDEEMGANIDYEVSDLDELWDLLVPSLKST
ncbi:MAG: TIGR02253 family HAD-type hydrolase [Candidatus Hodarchaeota archaeon]